MSQNGIKIFSEENCLGQVTVYDQTVYNAEPGKASCGSIQVLTGEWLVYNQKRFQETNALLKIGTYPGKKSIQDHSQNGDWTNEARSLRPVNQDGITLFNMNFYCGNQEHYTASNNKVFQECRSIIVRGPGKWEVYTLGDYQPNGKPIFTLAQGEYDASTLASDKGFIQVGSVRRL